MNLVQRINRAKVLELIRSHGGITRPKIAKMTGLSLSSITNIVTFLMENGLVESTGAIETAEVGRKAERLRFAAYSKHLLVFAVDSHEMTGVICDLGGNVLFKEVAAHSAADNGSTFVKDLGVFARGMLAKGKDAHIAISAAGLCISGYVQRDKLLLSRSLRLHNMDAYALLDGVLSEDIPLYLQDISRMRAFSQMEGLEMPDNVIFVDFCDGIGITNIYEGHISKSVAGEIGHTTVEKDGPECFCGNTGCLEIMCSARGVVDECSVLLREGRAPALAREMGERGSGRPSIAQIERAALAGDADVLGVLHKTAEYLGIGLASSINMFHPQSVIINMDELMHMDLFFEDAIEQTKKRAYADFIRDVHFFRVNTSTDQTIRGMARYMCDSMFDFNSVYL